MEFEINKKNLFKLLKVRIIRSSIVFCLCSFFVYMLSRGDISYLNNIQFIQYILVSLAFFLIPAYYLGSYLLDVIFGQIIHIRVKRADVRSKKTSIYADKSYYLSYIDSNNEDKKIEIKCLDVDKVYKYRMYTKGEVTVYYTKWSKVILGVKKGEEVTYFF